MPLDKDTPPIAAGGYISAGFRGIRQQLQARNRRNRVARNLRISGMGRMENIIKALEERHPPLQQAVFEYARKLPSQLSLLQPIEIMQASLGTPANEQRRKHMALAPLQDAAELRPVGYLLKGQPLYRRPGHNHAIVPRFADLRKGLIKARQMAGIGMGASIGLRLQQIHLNL